MKYTIQVMGFLACLLVISTQHAKPSEKVRGYTNGKWVMTEGEIQVRAPDGKLAIEHKAWHPVGPVRLEIIWTHNNDYKWNYTTNPSPKEDELPGPSVPVFMEKEFDAKSVLWTVVPDTPYRLATINGRFAPVLWDTDKAVLWRLNGLESVLSNSDTIIVKDRMAELVQPGGDWAAFLTIDLSNGSKGVQIRYRERFDGY